MQVRIRRVADFVSFGEALMSRLGRERTQKVLAALID